MKNILLFNLKLLISLVQISESLPQAEPLVSAIGSLLIDN